MKQSAKPMSSPNRTDHFPPPLVSFLRAEVGSRSRSGRSRSTSSPIFVRKKDVNVTIETQEPSSPKVTCMGQVRARRTSSKTAAATPARCRWITTVASLTRRHCRTFRSRWALLLRRMRETRRKPSNSESRVGNETEDSEKDEENGGGEAGDRVFATSVSLPPKNALILTRCRSAPHRSSYSYRYRSSPMSNGGTGQELKTERDNGSSGNKATSQRESGSSGLLKEVENSVGEGDSNSVNSKESQGVEEEEKEVGESSRPLILTRCKSEPGRIAEKLYGKLNFQEEERSITGTATATNDSCLPNNMQSND